VSSPTDWVALIRDATEIVMQRLSALPASPQLEELRLRCDDYLQQAQGWLHKAPTVEERERVMKRVLGLHVEVAKLERQAPER
jgi:hypothetical protein